MRPRKSTQYPDNEDRRTTSITVRNDILKFVSENKMSLSEFVNVEFVNRYLGLNAKVKRFEECSAEREQLRSEIKAIKERVKEQVFRLTAHELRFIATVTPRRRKGYNITAMKNSFNYEFNRKFSLDDFCSVVDFYEETQISRLKSALVKSKRQQKH